MDPDEDAARLLERMAGEVPVAPAPVGRVMDAARRLRRRRRLLTALTRRNDGWGTASGQEESAGRHGHADQQHENGGEDRSGARQ